MNYQIMEREAEYLSRQPWKSLEFEEQAAARQLIRAGLLRLEGRGRTARLVKVAPSPGAP